MGGGSATAAARAGSLHRDWFGYLCQELRTDLTHTASKRNCAAWGMRAPSITVRRADDHLRDKRNGDKWVESMPFNLARIKRITRRPLKAEWRAMAFFPSIFMRRALTITVRRK